MTWKPVFHCAGVVSMKLADPASDPALLTRMSMRPNRLIASPTQRAISSSLVTSRVRARAVPPDASISAAISASSVVRSYVVSSRVKLPVMSVITTAAPSVARRWAMARPMPRGADAPVMRATCPDSAATGLSCARGIRGRYRAICCPEARGSIAVCRPAVRDPSPCSSGRGPAPERGRRRNLRSA